MRTVAYLRVSTIDQDLEKNKLYIYSFANYKKLGTVEFVEEKVTGSKAWGERKIGKLIDELKQGDTLIVPELSRLGRKMLHVLEIMEELTRKKITFYSIKENFTNQRDDIASTALIGIFATLAEVERKLISSRTKEALKAKKEQGYKLGRPKGKGKSKLDDYKLEIVSMLKAGVPKTKIAKKYNTLPQNLYNWLKMNDIDYKEFI